MSVLFEQYFQQFLFPKRKASDAPSSNALTVELKSNDQVTDFPLHYHVGAYHVEVLNTQGTGGSETVTLEVVNADDTVARTLTLGGFTIGQRQVYANWPVPLDATDDPTQYIRVKASATNLTAGRLVVWYRAQPTLDTLAV